MVVMIVLAWAVAVPVVVVVGLFAASKILGARHRRAGAIDVTWAAEVLERYRDSAGERAEPREAPFAPVRLGH